MLMKKVRKSLGFSKKNNVFLIILIIIFIVVSCLLGYTIYLRNNISKNINQNITKEYGQTITINDIVKKGTIFITKKLYEKFYFISLQPFYYKLLI